MSRNLEDEKMVKAYSIDLRDRVLKYLESNNDKKLATSLFSIGISTIYRWIKLKKETGSCQAKKRKFAYKYIDDEKLRKYVDEHPDDFLWEIAQHFSVTRQGIFYALRRLKITRKKNNILQRKG